MKAYEIRLSVEVAERDAAYQFLQEEIAGAEITDPLISDAGVAYFSVSLSSRNFGSGDDRLRRILHSNRFNSLKRLATADRDWEFRRVGGDNAVQAIFTVDRSSAASVLMKLEMDFGDEGCAIGSHEIEGTGKTRIDIIFASSSPAEVDHHVHHCLGMSQLEDFSASVVEDIDWVAESLKGLPVVRTNRFLICGDHNFPQTPAGPIPVKIPAAEAFGTGHHGTTTGCLDAIATVCKSMKPRAVLDAGTGSGILGIAAAKLVKCPVIGTDIDPKAVRTANLNALENSVGHLFHAVHATGADGPAVADNGPYDIVVANILAKPLLGLANDLTDMMSRDGVLILSGLVHSQVRRVFARYRANGLFKISHIRRGEWSTLILGR